MVAQKTCPTNVENFYTNLTKCTIYINTSQYKYGIVMNLVCKLIEMGGAFVLTKTNSKLMHYSFFLHQHNKWMPVELLHM